MTRLQSEIDRLRGMIEYCLEGPDAEQIKNILWFALNGCTGADNVDQVRAKHGTWAENRTKEVPAVPASVEVGR